MWQMFSEKGSPDYITVLGVFRTKEGAICAVREAVGSLDVFAQLLWLQSPCNDWHLEAWDPQGDGFQHLLIQRATFDADILKGESQAADTIDSARLFLDYRTLKRQWDKEFLAHEDYR
jgi:hypothetical protein